MASLLKGSPAIAGAGLQRRDRSRVSRDSLLSLNGTLEIILIGASVSVNLSLMRFSLENFPFCDSYKVANWRKRSRLIYRKTNGMISIRNGSIRRRMAIGQEYAGTDNFFPPDCCRVA